VEKLMRPDEAVQLVKKRFPFQDYMTSGSQDKGAYGTVGDTVLRHLQPGSRILDFGCGPCDKTAVVQQLGFRCTGYDDLQDEWHQVPGNIDKIRAFAAECGIDFRPADGGALPFAKQSFDMVMMLDVLEHLHDSPRDLMNDLLELVRPGGLLFVTVPNAVNIRKRLNVLFGRTNLPRFDSYYWYPGKWRGHVREYVRDDLARLAEYLGVDVLELRACDHMLEKLPRAILPVYRIVTGAFPGWKDSWLLVAKKPAGWTPRRTLPRDEFTQILGNAGSFQYQD
jgi:2-polyprenyl-3-methyl-5-hydroxy-6-metoxy-1,4-benzoquinol methylase